MSTMLEQAIVDAKALKEAAIKNAEDTLIEKYADNIRDAVDSLLEQEEEINEAEEDMEMDLGADPMGELPSDSVDAPPAAVDGEALCPCPDDDEEIVIDFDELAKAVDKEEAAMEDDAVGSLDDIESLVEPLEESQEDEEIDLESLRDVVAQVMAEEAESNSEEEVLEEEEATDEDDEEETVEEALTVDYDPQPSGTIGSKGITNNAEMQDELHAALASQRDDERAAEREELDKTIEDMREQIEKMANDQEKYLKVINHLKEEVEKTNLSNAKLLYTNKILNSGSLNERQIEKIAEAISNANTVEEAKVIYETLQSAVESSGKSKNPKSLSEAISKRSPAFMPRHEKPAEANTEIARWKHLAGIK